MPEFRLETERLLLRDWREADFAPFLAMSLDPEVMRYFPPTDADGVRALIARQTAMQANCGHSFWAAERRDDGQFVGIIGLGAPRGFLTEIDVGWRLARPYWGRGYATEGAAAALAWAWAHLADPAIIAVTTEHNAPSRRVMDRLGMTFRPDESFDHPDLAPDDPLSRHVLYRLHRPA